MFISNALGYLRLLAADFFFNVAFCDCRSVPFSTTWTFTLFGFMLGDNCPYLQIFQLAWYILKPERCCLFLCRHPQGMYPESHGIVGNTIYDPELPGRKFKLGKPESLQPEWWIGEPVWHTVRKMVNNVSPNDAPERRDWEWWGWRFTAH